jgi:hypothetical protein
VYAFSVFPGILAIAFLLDNRKISGGVFFCFSLTAAIIFGILYGLRDYTSGTDSYVYAVAYESGDFHRWEPGYVFWLRFLRLFSEGYQVYFAVETFLKLGLLIWSAYNVSKVVGYSLGALFLLLVLYSFTSFDLFTNGLRQGLAMTVAILGASFYFCGRYRLALITTALTPFFHLSYLLYLFCYLLAQSYFRKSSVVRYCLIALSSLSFISIFLGANWLAIFEPFLLKIGSYIGRETNISVYSEMTIGSFASLNMNGRLQVLAILGSSLFALAVINRSKLNFDNFLIVIVSILIFFYGLVAHLAYSYRFLYLVTSLSPFLVVWVVRFIGACCADTLIPRAAATISLSVALQAMPISLLLAAV